MRTFYYSISLMVLLMGLQRSFSPAFADCDGGRFTVTLDKDGKPFPCKIQKDCIDMFGFGNECNLAPNGKKYCPEYEIVCLTDQKDAKQNKKTNSPKSPTK
ncbi:MAG: hypothetical protein H0X26_04565 [Alphaproteobacteria bacterium]|nr:hypothetical protein [Alphaproteobacteria bacterium]